MFAIRKVDEKRVAQPRRDVFVWVSRIMGEMHAVGDALTGDEFAGALSSEEQRALTVALDRAWHLLAAGAPIDAPTFLRARWPAKAEPAEVA